MPQFNLRMYIEPLRLNGYFLIALVVIVGLTYLNSLTSNRNTGGVYIGALAFGLVLLLAIILNLIHAVVRGFQGQKPVAIVHTVAILFFLLLLMWLRASV